MVSGVTAATLAILALSCGQAATKASADDIAAERWIAANAAPIATVSPEVAGHDLAAVDAIVGGARIVGLGEATHGNREFFQLKDRIFRHLVEADGFTGFAIEADYAEAEAIDAYVHGGPGDAETLVGNLAFWTWDTDEVVELVRWMRAYNQTHARKISFHGVDIQFAPSTLAMAFDYLERVDPNAAPRRSAFARYLADATDIAAGYKATDGYPVSEEDALRATAEALFQYFDANRTRLAAASGEPTYLRARAAALASAWYFLMQGRPADFRFRGLREEYDVRDRAMADLAEAALEMEGKQGRVFLWAHDAHISRAPAMDARLTMGHFLSDDLGADYVGFGQHFDHGAFQAYPPRDPAHPDARLQLSEMRVSPAPPAFSEAVLRAGPSPAYVIDLRKLDPGTPAYRWFAARRPLRWTGSDYSPALMAKHPPISLTQSYDAVIFVQETTRSRPTAHSRSVRGVVKTW